MENEKLVLEAIEAVWITVPPGYYSNVRITGYQISILEYLDGVGHYKKVLGYTQHIGIRGTVTGCELLVTEKKSYLILNREIYETIQTDFEA